MPKVFALVPAAGQGTRIGDAVPKQYIPLAGKPMMFHAIDTLAAVPRIERLFVCLSPLDRHWGAQDWTALPEKVEAGFTGGGAAPGAGRKHQHQGDLRRGAAGGGDDPAAPRPSEDVTVRIGQGFDVHALAAGRRLVIGGVEIAHDKGLAGHSDADVLLHAICDALLGAAALGDIGKHFPDTDPRYKGIDSRELLRHVAKLLRDLGLRVVNVDATIIAEAPRMAPHIPAMVANIAADLAVPRNAANVKATTPEKLGFAGRGAGIAAQAIFLIV